jgi:sugar lactone lactonase YvrE
MMKKLRLLALVPGLFLVFLFEAAVSLSQSTSGEISTLVGNATRGAGGDGGPAKSASLNSPEDIALDPAGNLFIVDSGNNRVRRVDATTGIITTVAGRADGFNGDGGPATSASLSSPGGIAVDEAGNLFIADTGNSRVRRVDAATGIITTVAGNGKFSFGGDGGRATSASLNSPEDVAVDAAGNLFIVDTFNSRIRRVDTNGNITTVAGNGRSGPLGDGGPAINASLILPDGIVVDRMGNLFVVDTENNRVRRVNTDGTIMTVAGNGSVGFGGDGGRAVNASLNFPEGIAIDGMGNLFIVDTENSRVRRIDAATGIIATVAGNGMAGFRGDGGRAIDASLNFPEEVALDAAGNLFIADTENNVIRSVKVAGGQPADFMLLATPSMQTVTSGMSAAYTINVQAINGFNQPVNLGAVLNPPNNNISLNFSSNTVTPGSNVMLTVITGANLPASTFTISITGTSGQITRIQNVILNVVTMPGPVTPVITGAMYRKPALSIGGSNFGSSPGVFINDQDVTSRITSINNTAIVLKGNRKKLNLRKGRNEIKVSAGGMVSNIFVLNL